MAGENTTEDETNETNEGGESGTGLLDAISEALEPTLPETPAGDTSEDSEDETNEDDESEGEEGAKDGEESEDGEDEQEGQTRGKDGKFKATDGDKGKPGEQKLGADGKPLPAAKTDPVNDPIPEEVKGRTRERMQSLIATVKEKDERIEVQNQLFDSIKDTGATPQEFGAMLGYMRWVHSDKPEDLKQARELLLNELEGISLKLGEAAPGVDFVAKHPDLQAKVDAGQISVEDATEMALHRQRTARETERRTADVQRETQTANASRERDAAIADLNTLGNTLRETDPDFARKHKVLKPILASFGELPPSKWRGAFLRAYKAVKLEPVQQAANGGKPSVRGQPLRANKSPSGGQNRQATSLFDAIDGAIEEASR